MFVFGRDTDEKYGVLGTLATALTKAPEESWQAIGWNLLYDHRVSEARAMDFYRREEPASPRELERAVRNYHWDVVCKTPEESYRSVSLNGHNFVNGKSVPLNCSFGHILNLSAWAKILYLENQLEAFIRTRRGAADDEEFLSRFLSSVNRGWDQRPIWLVRWSEFERFIVPGRPSTWNTSAGVWRQTGDWQVVLRFSPGEFPELVRPTQLDAGFCEYHFPSPPSLSPDGGGLAMELREVPRRNLLVPEFIHSPVELSINHWEKGGRRLAMVDETANAPMVYRSQHRLRLAAKYPSSWIPPK